MFLNAGPANAHEATRASPDDFTICRLAHWFKRRDLFPVALSPIRSNISAPFFVYLNRYYFDHINSAGIQENLGSLLRLSLTEWFEDAGGRIICVLCVRFVAHVFRQTVPPLFVIWSPPVSSAPTVTLRHVNANVDRVMTYTQAQGMVRLQHLHTHTHSQTNTDTRTSEWQVMY